MPRFSEEEKSLIREDLLAKGEQLFVQHGLKKVTVDDLTKAAAIAKGSFYAFFENKEHLYVEILFRIQNKVLADTEVFLQENSSLPPKELVRELIVWSFDGMEKYPMLAQQDLLELRTHLTRKLPKEILGRYPDLDMEGAKLLVQHGIKFKYETEIVGNAFQALSLAFDGMHGYEPEKKEAVVDILINGIVNEIVEE